MRHFLTKVVQKTKTIFCSKTFSRNCVIYEIMWKILYSGAGRGTGGIAIRRMCFYLSLSLSLSLLHLLLFHGNCSHANAPYCDVIRTLTVLLVLQVRDKKINEPKSFWPWNRTFWWRNISESAVRLNCWSGRPSADRWWRLQLCCIGGHW
jgi:hypothetical protein